MIEECSSLTHCYRSKVSDAEVAIARDDDIHGIIGVRILPPPPELFYLSCLFQLEDWPIDFATYLRRIQPPVQVEDHCQHL